MSEADFNFGGFRISARMVDSLKDYIDLGIPVGDFLQAIIANDFIDACFRADHTNVQNLPAFAYYLHFYTPGGCHGSREKYKKWIKHKGLAGLRKE